METNYKNNIKKTIILSVVINGVLPLVIYKVLENYVPNITALLISTTIPIIDNVYHIIKDKKIDIFASLVILGFVIGIVSVLLGGNERMLLIRQSYITGVMGLVFLISMLFPKPIIYYLAEKYISSPSKDSKSFLEEKWKNLNFKRRMRLITFVWGIALFMEALVNIILVFLVSTSQYLTISPFVSYGFIGLAIYITTRMRKKFKNKNSVKEIS